MTNIRTTYMGIPLESPIIVAASSISSMIERIKQAEQAGAGAIVIRSLFEEQILIDAFRMDDALAVGSDIFPEALSYFPEMKHGEADEHLMWIEKTRAEVKIPLIASLNAITIDTWTRYAKQLENTGVDGLELNVYAVETDLNKAGLEIERSLFETVEAVVREVQIPVAIKLSPFYTSVANIAHELDKRNVRALVLFNRFLQPDIDISTESLQVEMTMSTPEEIRVPLRWIALLHGRIKTDLVLNTGIHSGLDVAKALLAGATIVQTASALIKNGIPYLSTMLRELEGWMNERGYEELEDFRGKMSQLETDDPFAFERAHYIKLLIDQR
jgi:dihydroorotate dehydrogenase (fumarate)